jgi:hypothetical protein
MNEANCRASPTLLIIGAITAAAPASMTREAVEKSPIGIRTMAGLPAKATAPMPRSAPDRSTEPCCISITAVSKPSRASCSAIIGSLMPTQAAKMHSPLLIRRDSVATIPPSVILSTSPSQSPDQRRQATTC